MCQEHTWNNLCIFRRNMKSHEQDVEVFVMYVLHFGVYRSMVYTSIRCLELSVWRRLGSDFCTQGLVVQEIC